MASYTNDAPYCLLPSCKKWETFDEWFPENVRKPKLLTLFFQNWGCSTFFTLLTPNFMYNFGETNEQSLRYLKTDHGRTNVPGARGRWTDKGDYLGQYSKNKILQCASHMHCKNSRTRLLKEAKCEHHSMFNLQKQNFAMCKTHAMEK